VLLVTVNNW